MAKLKDIQRWAQGHSVDGLPLRPDVRPPKPRGGPTKLGDVDIEALFQPTDPGKLKGMTRAKTKAKTTKPKYGKARYKISTGGSDALIQFGRHEGDMLTTIAKRDMSYLDWIIKEEFPDDLKDVARHVRTTVSAKISAFDEVEEDEPYCGADGCKNLVPKRRAPSEFCSMACGKNHEHAKARKPIKCKTPRCKNPSGAPGGYCSMACERDHRFSDPPEDKPF